MAKQYGGRWELIRDIGKGGQGDVFEARDLLASKDAATVALKRVKNPNRHSRFRNEVESIKKLSHPNVIKLIDHSALDVEANAPEKQYLVMPLASGGDLPKRVSMYKGNLDGTLIVARQIASALVAAHAVGIVHRDVKPQNILFAEESNEVWLTDFGICFLQDEERHTREEEVVGPWAFIAPELEHGGVLDVQPSADVYSLGKLIYYMISGGIVVPREKISDPEYAIVFAAGGRYHLLNLLLSKMVCDLNNRLSNMSEVENELTRIANWDQQSALVPVTPQTRSKLETLQQAVLQNREVAAANLANVQAQQAVESRVQAHLMQWLQSELEKTASVISGGGVISTAVQAVSEPDLSETHLNDFRPKSGLELVIADVSTRSNVHHVLQIFFCIASKVTVHITINGQSGAETPIPPKDRDIGLLPVYMTRSPARVGASRGSRSRFFFGINGELVTPLVEGYATQQIRRPQRAPFAHQGGAQKTALFTHFRFSEWPAVEHTIRDFMTICCDHFIGALGNNRNSVFPM